MKKKRRELVVWYRYEDYDRELNIATSKAKLGNFAEVLFWIPCKAIRRLFPCPPVPKEGWTEERTWNSEPRKVRIIVEDA